MKSIPINNICHSTINGPGNRLVIWTQGCHFHCKGCFNPETHAIDDAKRMSISKLVSIVNADKSIEGITISGGEPLLYTEELYKLFARIRKRLTRIIFTGYSVEEIFADEEKKALLSSIDIIIAGRYNENLPHPYYGKKIIKVSDRVDESYFSPTQHVEYVIGDTKVTKTGIFKHI